MRKWQDGKPTHVYISTACMHDEHDQCRLTCKFCDAPCYCWHHKEKPAEETSAEEE